MTPSREQHAGVVVELAAFLVSDPNAISKLLLQHENDGRGSCRVCTSGAQRGNLSWPCTTRRAAELAARTRSTARDIFP